MMKGSIAYATYRTSILELELLASTAKWTASMQHNLVKKFRENNSDIEIDSFIQAYSEKLVSIDFEAVMAKQLLIVLCARFEAYINKLFKFFLIKNEIELKNLISKKTTDVIIDYRDQDEEFDKIIGYYIYQKSYNTMKERLTEIYELIPDTFQSEVDRDEFLRIDHYFVVRNMFIHNDDIITKNAVSRDKYFAQEDIGKSIKVDIDEFKTVFEVFSDTACTLSGILDKIDIAEGTKS